MNTLTYYGRGPLENYIDRYSSSFIGRYEDKVENQFYWYIRPQETGNKTDVRWLTLLDSEGQGSENYRLTTYRIFRFTFLAGRP